MGELTIRRAKEPDMENILKIYEHARAFMAQTGNPNQWVNGYPGRELLTEDIRRGELFAVCHGEELCGVFYFHIGPDPTYGYLEGGTWRSDRPYGTIHRIASDGMGGVFAACFAFCKSRIGHIRIDTHHDNKPMQHIVEKAGFSRRGIIYLADGSPRIAYDYV